MSIPQINPLPQAPSRTQPQDDFNVVADSFFTSLSVFCTETNVTIGWFNNQVSDISEAQGVAGSAALAATGFAVQAEDARDQAVIAASAAQASAGLPALAGNGGKVLAVRPDESGVEYIDPVDGFGVGNVAAFMIAPDNWLKCDGAVYLAVDWPDLALLLDAVGYTDPGQFSPTDWQVRSGTAAHGWNCIVYAPEIETAVAVYGHNTNGAVMRCVDGENWHYSPQPAFLAGIGHRGAWSPELGLFAIPGQGAIHTSPDGVIWNSHSISGPVRAIAWSSALGAFCAVGGNPSSSVVLTSFDGITWTPQVGPNATAASTLSDVAWSPSQNWFIAVSRDTNQGRVFTSPTGAAWSARTPAVYSVWNAIAWSPTLGLYVAVGANSTVGSRIMTSPNGITWTTRSSSLSNLISVIWSPELALFVAASSDNNSPMMTSPNGITWTARVSPSFPGRSSMVWASAWGAFIAPTSGGNSLLVNDSAFVGNAFRTPIYADVDDQFSTQDAEYYIKAA